MDKQGTPGRSRQRSIKMAGMRYPGYSPDKNDKSPGLSLMLSLAMNTATHPLTTVKVLVQVGFKIYVFFSF